MCGKPGLAAQKTTCKPADSQCMPGQFPRQVTLSARGVLAGTMLTPQGPRPVQGDGHVAHRGPPVLMPRLCQGRTLRPRRLDASHSQLSCRKKPVANVRRHEMLDIRTTAVISVERLDLVAHPQVQATARILDRSRPTIRRTSSRPWGQGPLTSKSCRRQKGPHKPAG